jgi:hypothetical protein
MNICGIMSASRSARMRRAISFFVHDLLFPDCSSSWYQFHRMG